MTLKITRYSVKEANLSHTDISSICITGLPRYICYHEDVTIPKIDYLFGQEKFHTVNLLETDGPELRCVSTLNNNEADPVWGSANVG